MSGAKETLRAQAANNSQSGQRQHHRFSRRSVGIPDRSRCRARACLRAPMPPTTAPAGMRAPARCRPPAATLDVAVQGQGWIAVQASDGSEAYTRAGDLHVDPNGQLMTATGNPVLGDSGPITVPPHSSITIGARRLGIDRAARPDAGDHRDRRTHQAGQSAERRSSTRGDDGLFRSTSGRRCRRRRQRAARAGHARVEQRQHRRRPWPT